MKVFCLHNDTLCPHGQIVHHRHDSVIHCNGRTKAILGVINSPTGQAKATAPRWCYLRGIVEEPKAKPKPKAEDTYTSGQVRRKLSPDQVRNIRVRLKRGETYAAIARDYGIGSTAIRRIHRRECYVDVI